MCNRQGQNCLQKFEKLRNCRRRELTRKTQRHENSCSDLGAGEEREKEIKRIPYRLQSSGIRDQKQQQKNFQE